MGCTLFTDARVITTPHFLLRLSDTELVAGAILDITKSICYSDILGKVKNDLKLFIFSISKLLCYVYSCSLILHSPL